MKLTVSKEDYLKAIAEAEAEEGAAIAATITRWIEVSPLAMALALTLRRLRRDKLAHVDRKGRIILTAAFQDLQASPIGNSNLPSGSGFMVML